MNESIATYNSKYNQILIDENKNSPNNMNFNLTVEQYYDLLHHTHRAEDIVGSISGGDEGESSNPVEEQTVEEMRSTIITLNQTVTNLQSTVNNLTQTVNQLQENLDEYITNDIAISDYDATTPGIQDENGNTV